MPEHQQIHQSKRPDIIFQKQTTSTKQIPLSNPMAIIQRAKINQKSLTHADVMQLQRTIGNRAVGRLLSGIGNSSSTAQQATVQRQEIPEEEKTCPSCRQRQEVSEEEESLQGKMIGTVQRQEIPEEEGPLQGQFEDKPEIACPSCFVAPIVQRQEIPEEEEPLQGKTIGTIQKQEIPEEEEPLQGKFIEPIQRQEIPEEEEPLQTKRENNTGMPDNLKAGVESLSGIDMSDVRVQYNSLKPAEVGALAYTQGTNIHVAPGQEKHLAHETWHVVQQKQGEIRPTMQLKGVAVNDDVRLEREANLMGEEALNSQASGKKVDNFLDQRTKYDSAEIPIQCRFDGDGAPILKIFNANAPGIYKSLYAILENSEIQINTVLWDRGKISFDFGTNTLNMNAKLFKDTMDMKNERESGWEKVYNDTISGMCHEMQHASDVLIDRINLPHTQITSLDDILGLYKTEINAWATEAISYIDLHDFNNELVTGWLSFDLNKEVPSNKIWSRLISYTDSTFQNYFPQGWRNNTWVKKDMRNKLFNRASRQDMRDHINNTQQKVMNWFNIYQPD